MTTASASPFSVPRSPRRRRITLIASIAAVVVAAATASAIALGSPPHGPHYASPRNVCGLLRPAALAKYLPGPGYSPVSHIEYPHAVGYGNASICQWFADQGWLDVYVIVYAATAGGPATAQQFFTNQVAERAKETTVDGVRTATFAKRSVTGLGDQATALLQTLSPPHAGTAPTPARAE